MIPIYPQGVLKLVPVENNGVNSFINVNNPYLIIDALDIYNNLINDLSATLDFSMLNNHYADELFRALKLKPIEGLNTFLNGNFDQSVLRSGMTYLTFSPKHVFIVEYPHKHI